MEEVETAEELLAKQHRKEKKDLQGKTTCHYYINITRLMPQKFPFEIPQNALHDTVCVKKRNTKLETIPNIDVFFMS